MDCERKPHLRRGDDTNTRKIEIAYDSCGESRKDRFVRSFPGDLLTRRRVGLVKPEGGPVAWFDRPDAEDAVWGYGLSKDGKSLFISSSDLSIKNHTIFMFDTLSGVREVFYESHDPVKIRPDWQVAFAPDGKGLIVLTDRDGYNHLHCLPASGAALEPITSGAWEIAEFALDAPNGKIYFIANETHPAERHVYSVALAGGAVSRLTGPAGIHVPAYTPDFSAFADLFSDDMTPPELFVQPASCAMSGSLALGSTSGCRTIAPALSVNGPATGSTPSSLSTSALEPLLKSISPHRPPRLGTACLSTPLLDLRPV